MNKQIIKVPTGIQFISEWKGYKLPSNQHCIVDKGVTGCGYTEYCLTNEDNIILCSPRTLLLENKSAQHKNDTNIYYAKNEIVDIYSLRDYEKRLYNHIMFCEENDLPCKILVTYDSLHHVINFLAKTGLLKTNKTVIDEFQSIFLDSFFKSEVELSLLETLASCKEVIYLSATPMLDKYLEKMNEFKNLTFYKLDWSETGYVETINIQRKRVNSLGAECGKIIESYLRGDYPITLNDNNELVQSKEAVFYFNSVTEIVRLLNKYHLTTETARVICSDTENNRKKLKKLNANFKPEKVPLRDELNPMFMFCTSTCYIGVDFYSDNAKSYVFADPNVTSLAMDISLDLPQIIGRQRNKSNPFKNDIVVYYKIVRHKEESLTEENFRALQEQRMVATKSLLDLYNRAATENERSEYLRKIRDGIQVSQYSGDFVSISKHTNQPVYNPLIDLAYERAWEVSQRDYQDNLSVTKSILDQGYVLKDFESIDEARVSSFLTSFFGTNVFKTRMRLLCEFMDEYQGNSYILDAIKHRILDQKYLRYYKYYGTKGCSARNFRETELLLGLVSKIRRKDLDELILGHFKVGERYSMSYIKSTLLNFYKDLGIVDRKPLATDLAEYFNLSRTRITLPNKSIVNGYKINNIRKE